MMRISFLLLFCLLLATSFDVDGQKVKTTKGKQQFDAAATEREVRQALQAFAADSVAGRREAMADHYPRAGYVSIGEGQKRRVSYEDTKRRYLTRWTSPQSYEWKDVSVEVLSANAAVVTALFDVTRDGIKRTFSHTGLFVKEAGKWVIRIKDESLPHDDYTINSISGDRSKLEPFSELMTAHPGACIGAHRHNADMHISVRKGRQFIIMGDLETARVQVFEAGKSFVIPKGVWHVEWFEEESDFEISGIGPMNTERPPSTPRTR